MLARADLILSTDQAGLEVQGQQEQWSKSERPSFGALRGFVEQSERHRSPKKRLHRSRDSPRPLLLEPGRAEVYTE